MQSNARTTTIEKRIEAVWPAVINDKLIIFIDDIELMEIKYFISILTHT